MPKSDAVFEINRKFFVRLVTIIAGLAGVLFALNYYDEHKKFTLFVEFYQSVTDSPKWQTIKNDMAAIDSIEANFFHIYGSKYYSSRSDSCLGIKNSSRLASVKNSLDSLRNKLLTGREGELYIVLLFWNKSFQIETRKVTLNEIYWSPDYDEYEDIFSYVKTKSKIDLKELYHLQPYARKTQWPNRTFWMAYKIHNNAYLIAARYY